MTGMMRVRYRYHHDTWCVYLYEECACKTTVHLASVADTESALARGDIGEHEAANARSMFMNDARQVIVGPVNG